MTNFISFLLVAVLGALVMDYAQADINCYLCSTLNTTSGGNCLVPDSTTQLCTLPWNTNILGSNIAAPPATIYSTPMCSVSVYYNGNRSPFRIDRSCASSGTPSYTVVNWVGWNTTFCATSLCNTFSASPPKFTCPSYLSMSLTSFAALLIMFSEKMTLKW